MPSASPNPSAKPALRHEPVQIQNPFLPVNISLRKNSTQSAGCELHWHEELEFYYVRQGGVRLLCNGTRQWILPGEVGFVNWCAPHRGEQFLQDTEHYIIQIGPELFSNEEICSEPGETAAPGSLAKTWNLLSLLATYEARLPLVFSQNETLNRLLDQLIEAKTAPRFGYELAVKSAVYGIFSLLVQSLDLPRELPARPKDFSALEHLKKLLAFLPLHCTQPEEVSLPALSARFGLSVPYLCKMFKQHTNLTLTAYVNELRCFRAAALIHDGATLEQAAALTGFHDCNYFSRVFKKVMGCPPSHYRKGDVKGGGDAR